MYATHSSSFLLFSLIGRSSPQGGAYGRHSNGLLWELCIKHVVQQSHRGALQHVCTCTPLPYGRPLWRHQQSSQSGVTVMNVQSVVLGFCYSWTILWRCSEKQRNWWGDIYLASREQSQLCRANSNSLDDEILASFSVLCIENKAVT